jgi:hypothetical protein
MQALDFMLQQVFIEGPIFIQYQQVAVIVVHRAQCLKSFGRRAATAFIALTAIIGIVIFAASG